MATKQANRVLLTIGDELLHKLDVMSEKIGVPRASLAVMLIADGVRSREQAEVFMSQLPNSIRDAMANPEVVKQFVKAE